MSHDKNPGSNAAVATAFPDATRAAVAVLKRGGNAVDAAVAAAFAISVCEPSGSGLGGQTSMMIQLCDGKTVYLDGHSTAPTAVSIDTVTRKAQHRGYRACVIPTTVATLSKGLQQFGSQSLEDVIAPAIEIARDGFRITALQRRQAQWCLNNSASSGKRPRVLRKNCWFRGPTLQQPHLAQTLEKLGKLGAQDFYQGELAAAIIDDQVENCGLISRRDLERMALPETRKPISIFYRGYEIISTPPPAGGLQLLLALKLMEHLYMPGVEPDLAAWYEAIALATFAAFEEREKFPIHPDDFTPSVQKWVLSDERVDELASRLTLQRQLKSIPDVVEEPGETTHLCVADGKGNFVSLTQSIQSLFGAHVANWQLGFIYNNYLTTCPRFRHPYKLGSRCLPRSNASPTMIMKDGEVVMTLGAAGSRRIISAILQVISRVLDLGMPLCRAVAAPRIHALLDGTLWLERPAAGQGLDRLQTLFHSVHIKRKHSFTMGGVQAMMSQTTDSTCLLAAADPRRDGTSEDLYS